MIGSKAAAECNAVGQRLAVVRRRPAVPPLPLPLPQGCVLQVVVLQGQLCNPSETLRNATLRAVFRGTCTDMQHVHVHVDERPCTSRRRQVA